jgi:N-acetylglucosaminyl-diphospho-decaprenol L-rhamnosyltransferase
VHPGHTPVVRFVVVNYNAGPLLARCLDSISAVRWPTEATQIWVIDNASTDGSFDAIDDDGITRIANTNNLGFGANNQAFEDLTGVDFVALINPDAWVEPNFLEPLIETLDGSDRLGGACPKIILDRDGEFPVIQNAGSYVLRNGNAGDIGFGEADSEAFGRPRDVFAFCGAAALLRTALVTDLDGFDQSFFLYYEDTDLSWRAQSAGWQFRYVPSAVVHHHHGYSSGLVTDDAATAQVRNRLTMMAKNAPLSAVVSAFARSFGAALMSIFRSGDGPSAPSRWRGLIGAVRRLPASLSARRNSDRSATRQVYERLENSVPRINTTGSDIP